jgi:hypothetical protein
LHRLDGLSLGHRLLLQLTDFLVIDADFFRTHIQDAGQIAALKKLNAGQLSDSQQNIRANSHGARVMTSGLSRSLQKPSKQGRRSKLASIFQMPLAIQIILPDNAPVKNNTYRDAIIDREGDHQPVRVEASEQLISPCFHLQKAGDVARLIFADDAWSEYRALDLDHPVEADEEVRLKLSMGDLGPADPEECLDAARALAAARHYLLHGERPDWLTYRYVR